VSQLRGPLAAASRAVLDAAPREPCAAPLLLRRMPAWAAATRLLLLPWARLHALADAELRAQGVAAELSAPIILDAVRSLERSGALLCVPPTPKAEHLTAEPPTAVVLSMGWLRRQLAHISPRSRLDLA